MTGKSRNLGGCPAVGKSEGLANEPQPPVSPPPGSPAPNRTVVIPSGTRGLLAASCGACALNTTSTKGVPSRACCCGCGSLLSAGALKELLSAEMPRIVQSVRWGAVPGRTWEWWGMEEGFARNSRFLVVVLHA